jgi:hypothetical protein
MRTRSFLLVLIGCLALSPCCSSPRQSLPEIAEIYRDSALEEARNPVIVIHGILGSRLVQRSTGRTVWGAFTSEGVDPETPEGARAVALSFQPGTEMERGEPDVYAAGPLDALRVSFLFQVISVKVYADIIRALGAGGYADRVAVDRQSPRYADDHYTCFTFFYDWRRDNVENAIALGRFIAEKRAEIAVSAKRRVARLEAQGSPASVAEAQRIHEWLARGYRFDIVAHSMGGLIAHYFLRYGAQDLPADGSAPKVTWAGTKEVDRLVMVGTPNFGSMEALENLVHGYDASFLLPRYDQSVLGTMPYLYQLLPRSRHRLLIDESGKAVELDLFDPKVWEANGWGLAAANDEKLAMLMPEAKDAAERRDRARGRLAWCLERARRFHQALDAKTESCPAQIHLYAADAQPTLTKGLIVSEGKRRMPQFPRTPALMGFGDGTVARYSALADERFGGTFRPGLDSPLPWASVTFLADDHVGLTRNPHFTNNMLFLLLERLPRTVAVAQK